MSLSNKVVIIHRKGGCMKHQKRYMYYVLSLLLALGSSLCAAAKAGAVIKTKEDFFKVVKALEPQIKNAAFRAQVKAFLKKGVSKVQALDVTKLAFLLQRHKEEKQKLVNNMRTKFEKELKAKNDAQVEEVILRDVRTLFFV